MTVRRPVLLAILLVSLAAAGCMGEGAVADASPEARAARAVEQFRAGVEADGDIRSITGAVEAEGTMGEIEMVLGADDVQKVTVSIGGFFTITMYCDQGRGITMVAGKAYESRSAECFDVGSDASSEKTEDPLDPLADTTLVEATENADGTLTARFTKADEDGLVSTITTTIDEQDRIVALLVEGGTTTMEMEVEYGERETVRIPSTTQRLPAAIDAETWFEDGHYAWTVLGTEETVPLAELELRVLDPSGEEGAAPLATFRFDGGAQESAGFTFRFVDDNGDGLVSAGDSFSLANPDWENEWDHRVVVFDTWAGLSIDENPMPFPGAAAVAALAGLALALRRRA